MSKKWKTVILIVLSALYLAALVTMFLDFGLGLILWGAALIPSLIWYLYQKNVSQLKLEEKLKEAEALEGENKE